MGEIRDLEEARRRKLEKAKKKTKPVMIITEGGPPTMDIFVCEKGDCTGCVHEELGMKRNRPPLCPVCGGRTYYLSQEI